MQEITIEIPVAGNMIKVTPVEVRALFQTLKQLFEDDPIVFSNWNVTGTPIDTSGGTAITSKAPGISHRF